MKMAYLKDVCDVTMGQAPPGSSYNTQNDGFPLVAGAGDLGPLNPIPKNYTTAPTRISSIGDIILCIRATIGDVNWSDRAYCLGRGVAGLTSHKDVLHPQYVWYWLRTSQKVLAREARGSTFKQVSRDAVESLRIPVPPLPEQRRITAILDKADAIRRKRQEAIRLTDEFLRSAFLEMFGDPVTNPCGWDIDALEKVCIKITDGTHDTPKRLESGVTFITGKHIKPYFIDFENCDHVSPEDHKEIIKRCNPEYGDILYTNIGVNVGTAAFNSWEEVFSMKNVALLKPNKEILLSRYLEFVLNHFGMKSKILGDSSVGGAQKFLSLAQIKRTRVPIPAFSAQEKFEDLVKNILKLLTKNNGLEYQSIRLFDSLVQRAFRGEL